MAWGTPTTTSTEVAAVPRHDWVAAILRALAGAARNGLPLLTALQALQDRPSLPTFRGARACRLRDLTSDLAKGVPLSHALALRLGRYLPAYVEEAVAGGEEHGCLADVLTILAENVSRQGTAASRFRVLLVYPVVQCATLLTVVSGLMVFIVPKFSKIFDEMASGEPLPGAMVLVIRAAELARSTIILVPLLGLGAPLLLMAVKRLGLVQRLCVHFPLLGPQVRRMALLEFSQAMGLLVASGRDIVGAAALSASASSSPLVRNRARELVKRIRKGVPWVEAWQDMRLGQPVHDWIVRNAVSAENPVGGFRDLGEWLADEISIASARIVKLVEPVLILANAAVIGLVVFALHATLVKLIYVAGGP